jgi:hypothetical protein
LLDRVYDVLEHAVCIRKGVIVPETQDAEAAFLQVGVTNLIACALGMLTAICFDDEHVLETDEVGDPGTERHLSSEFYV